MTIRDVVVVGASMGGIEALRGILAGLPPELPATVLVVQHTGQGEGSQLAPVLRGNARIAVELATHEQPHAAGVVYVAPPGRHLVVHDGRMILTTAPRENRARPAIDPLFRTAATAYGTRVIGLVLTGLLDDGAAGLAAIKDCGGTAIVQDPGDALWPDMPRAALAAVAPDHVVPAAQVAPLLTELCGSPTPATPEICPDRVLLESRLALGSADASAVTETLGPLGGLSCTECGGPMWEVAGAKPARYRCHVGHALTLAHLIDAQRDAVETGLITAMRVLEDRRRALRKLLQEAAGPASARIMEERLRDADEQLDVLRRLIFRVVSRPPDPV